MFNRVVLVGNLTRNIELRYTSAGRTIGVSGIATSRKYKIENETKEEICFIDVVFYGKSAEIASQYLSKGSQILVEGRILFQQWKNDKGENRSKHLIAVENMRFLDKKESQSKAPKQTTPSPTKEQAISPDEVIDVGEIPF